MLIRESVMNPRATALQVRNETGGEAAHVSLRTIQRYLRAGGRFPYRPQAGPTLGPKQKEARVQWANIHKNWSVLDWRKVS